MEYEIVREIFNRCANNQMRDVFVSEAETGDPVQYVRDFLRKPDLEPEAMMLPDGSWIVDADADGLRQRFSFTPV